MQQAAGVGKPQSTAVSPRSGVAPPEETRFGAARGNPGNRGGFPKGFVPLSRALAILGTLTDQDVAKIAEGERPRSWGKRKLPMSVVMAARLWQARDRLSTVVAEIADRTEGKVKSTTDLNVTAPDLATFFSEIAKRRAK